MEDEEGGGSLVGGRPESATETSTTPTKLKGGDYVGGTSEAKWLALPRHNSPNFPCGQSFDTEESADGHRKEAAGTSQHRAASDAGVLK